MACGRRWTPSWKAGSSTATPAASADEVRARTLDSLRAIMMIRAYRMRGHLKANLDPLGLAVTAGDASELDPATYGFAEADFDRPIFLDFVLGLETATLREILALLKRTYCGTIGVQYMHITDPAEKAWLQRRIEGRDKEISFTRGRQDRHPQEADRGRGLRALPRTSASPAPSASASTAPRPRCRRWSRSSSAAAPWA